MCCSIIILSVERRIRSAPIRRPGRGNLRRMTLLHLRNHTFGQPRAAHDEAPPVNTSPAIQSRQNPGQNTEQNIRPFVISLEPHITLWRSPQTFFHVAPLRIYVAHSDLHSLLSSSLPVDRALSHALPRRKSRKMSLRPREKNI